ncbi:MAG: hypothetical protein HUJ26_18705 [Planctomycetaceae bacterium]|nr:hypothetical protein [Planctomycetaceae bacterium]
MSKSKIIDMKAIVVLRDQREDGTYEDYMMPPTPVSVEVRGRAVWVVGDYLWSNKGFEEDIAFNRVLLFEPAPVFVSEGEELRHRIMIDVPRQTIPAGTPVRLSTENQTPMRFI